MATSGPRRRPRLSLQIKPEPGPKIRSKNTLAHIDPRSPTAFNTLSNVYATAAERSLSTPTTVINLGPPLRLQTTNIEPQHEPRPKTLTPYLAAGPRTPPSASSISPMSIAMEMRCPSQMTTTPPLSAGPTEEAFPSADNGGSKPRAPSSPLQSSRRAVYGSSGSGSTAPYTHPRTLHSILRNSPLPPPSAKSPISPRRQSRRLQERACRRVGYESPLTQTITTEMYTKSHVDLLAEDASPFSPSPPTEDSDMALDWSMVNSRDATRDGGRTPGPYEEARRRRAGLAGQTPGPVSSPGPGGIRKRGKKEKKRKWVWTIGQDGSDNDDDDGSVTALPLRSTAEVSTPRTAVPMLSLPAKAATPDEEPGEWGESEANATDADMTDVSSVVSTHDSSGDTTPCSEEGDMKMAMAGACATTARTGQDRLRLVVRVPPAW